MDSSRKTSKLAEWTPEESRGTGTPRKSWRDSVERDLRELRVRQWWRVVDDRKRWYEILEKTRPHQGFIAPEEEK